VYFNSKFKIEVVICHLSFVFLLSSLLLVFLAACSLGGEPDTSAQSVTPVASATPSPTPTNPPPPPKVTFTPVDPGTVSPIIVQRFPRRGEELVPDGTVELIFDRAMNSQAVEDAFTLQSAAEQPQIIEGDFAWADAGRTMRFTPTQMLERNTTYDAILTQAAVAEDGAPLAEPFTFRFNTPGFLEVAQVIPADGTTDVETNPTITVMFNRPIVPLPA